MTTAESDLNTNSSRQLLNPQASIGALGKATRWSTMWGILMFILGILAVSLPQMFSIGIAIVLGWLILFAGILHLIFAFHSYYVAGFLRQVLLAAFYGMVAIYLLANPLLGVVTLTLLLAVFLLLEGGVEILLYFSIRRFQHSWWVLVDGIATLILGILMCSQWPPSSPWVIGTLVGISLMFSGISRVMLSFAVRGLSPAAALMRVEKPFLRQP
jgi:uncharacterized membrane protein HdeD (DUF308 family)